MDRKLNMEDFKRMDSLTQSKLTRAIQKAATLAIGSDEDRSKLLAQQLKDADIPKQLTKTATAAFNRRLSVITLGKRNQDTKADTFQLADFNKVAEYRGCASLDKKASMSVAAPFKYSVTKPAIQKKASLQQAHKQLTVEQALRKIASVVDKTAIEFQEGMYELQQQQYILKDLIKKASAAINSDIRTGRLLATVYGDSYKELFKQTVNQSALKKQANYAILPKNITVELTQKAIQQYDLVNLKRDMLSIKKNAAKILAQQAVAFQQLVNERILNGTLSKKAGVADLLRQSAVNMITIPGLVAGGAMEGAYNTASDYARDISGLLSQRYAINPQSAITAKLMNSDRYDDKANRLTDILADSDFKDYKVQDIQAAVSAAISQHPEFISPRYKQYLKTAVSNRLIAGGKTNTATQAAQAELLKRITQVDSKRDQTSVLKKIKQMKAVEGKDIRLSDVLPKVNITSKPTVAEYLKLHDLSKPLGQIKSKFKAIQEEKQLRDQQTQQARLEGFKQYMKAREALIKKLMETSAGKDTGRYLRDALRKQIQALPLNQQATSKQHQLLRLINRNIDRDVYEFLSPQKLEVLQEFANRYASSLSPQEIIAQSRAAAKS